MTNTGFVALPILHSIYGQPAVLPAAIATVFVAAVMFPTTVILLESEGRGGGMAGPIALVKQIVLNPMVLSTLIVVAPAADAAASCVNCHCMPWVISLPIATWETGVPFAANALITDSV